MKPIFRSKIFWANVIAVVAMIAQGFTGFPVSPEIQGAALAIINIILRTVTKEAVTWGRE